MMLTNTISFKTITKISTFPFLPRLPIVPYLNHYRWLENVRNDTAARAGGYFVEEYYGRSLFEAFSGLTFFVDEEAARIEEEKRAITYTDLMISDAVS